MASDIEKRARYKSPKPFSSVTPRGEITLAVSASLKKQQQQVSEADTDDVTNPERSRNMSLGKAKSARQNQSIARLLQPIGNLSTAMKKSIDLTAP